MNSAGFSSAGNARSVGELQCECRYDPSSQRMAEERGALDCERLKKTLQHLYKSGDAVGDIRFVGSAKPEQLQRDHAMAGGKRLKAEGPLIGVPAKAMDEHQGWPTANVVITDFSSEDCCAAQFGKRWQRHRQGG